MAGNKIAASVHLVEQKIDYGQIKMTDNEAVAIDLSSKRLRTEIAVVTLAQLNAGHVILPAVPGRQYQLTDFFIKFNGTFTTATDIRLSTTEGSPTDIATILIANAGDNVVHRPGVGTHTLNDAAFAVALAAGAGIQIRKTGSSAAGGTDITVVLTYRIAA